MRRVSRSAGPAAHGGMEHLEWAAGAAYLICCALPSGETPKVGEERKP